MEEHLQQMKLKIRSCLYVTAKAGGKMRSVVIITEPYYCSIWIMVDNGSVQPNISKSQEPLSTVASGLRLQTDQYIQTSHNHKNHYQHSHLD